MMPDHYATLGVERTANAATIRAAYLALMREYHPDRNDSPEATLRAQAVIGAFKVLGDFDRRNHYDWDRRREREAALAAAASAPSDRKLAVAVGAGLVALAGLAAWALDPRSASSSVQSRMAEKREMQEPAAGAQRAEERRVPSDLSRTELERVEWALVSAPVPIGNGDGTSEVERSDQQPQARAMRRDNPLRLATTNHKSVKRESKPVIRVASPPEAARQISPAPGLSRTPASRAATDLAKPVQQDRKAANDLASLDQFVMNFYGQSWRHGDAPRRAALVQSKADFAARRGACAADSCKRDATLKLMRDVSAIVETGQR